MEPRASYTAVGAFVLALGSALLAMGLWLGSDISTQSYKRYSVYFTESVSGLNRDAAVKYHGVRVGRVAVVELAPADPNRVHVLLEVEADTPIKVDTRARLDVQGLTGLAHVELSGGDPRSPALPSTDPHPPYPELQTDPSLMTRVDQALSDGLSALEDIGGRLDQLLSGENIARFSDTLENLRQLSATLRDERETLSRTLRNAERLSADAARAGERLPGLMAELDTLVAEYLALKQTLNQAGENVSGFAKSGERGMNRLTRSTLPRLDAVLARIDELSVNLGRLGDELNDNPQLLIYGRPRPKPGPGE
ncbi:MlaD family protein [Alkalilimnicola sp. S0819]|uniref:MlaD family protein n=1 Tax=Alkalilimnicola sp. S0819 TaxID=2613922 RepID=UPI0012619FDC|nr:MlaD family protein [Alkalilimnicola sp. S0819]KAB7627214.1 MCE family protein [Alkalilimnicola sp. S0819]MPQ15927.1 MCE family protein [Alkalilimnicola sp. S0819]